MRQVIPASSRSSRSFCQPPVKQCVFFTQAMYLAFQHAHSLLETRDLRIFGSIAFPHSCCHGRLLSMDWREIAQSPNFSCQVCLTRIVQEGFRDLGKPGTPQ